ncbi:MAG TPA: hypothetical protein PKY77_22390 [Phycisphaerae bacterium]|nr:hypothetical protein [Phycisphaerae bacterium]HRY71273.1 hypothetical protein [Phycisphaerae bacterium]HSA29635.1 hypothetical protein [Phycisphaerae bacterium]
MMYGTGDKDLTKDPRGLECEAEMDLGFLGTVRVRGRTEDGMHRS